MPQSNNILDEYIEYITAAIPNVPYSVCIISLYGLLVQITNFVLPSDDSANSFRNAEC